MHAKAGLAAAFATFAVAAAVACDDGGPPSHSASTATVARTGEAPADRLTTLGRDVLALASAGDADAIWERFDERLVAAYDREEWATTFAGTFGEFGALGERISERTERFLGFDTYHAAHRFENVEDVIELIIAFDDAERISLATYLPLHEAPSDYLDYEAVTPLRLPFNGEWFVVWGGRTASTNHHAGHVDQRFAIDFVLLDGERTFEGDGLLNEDYHCFGEPVLAPAEGSVVVAVDGIDDNAIGETNAAAPAGNHMVIDHGNGEFSLLAHFMKDSVLVQQGSDVAPGQTLARCGNSGNSSEPHVHYHLQNGPMPFQAEGLPAFFQDYTADGTAVDRGEPLRGQTVSNR